MEDQLGAAVRFGGGAVVGDGYLDFRASHSLNADHLLARRGDEVFAGRHADIVHRKCEGDVTVAETFWAYAGTKLIRTSATAARVM